MLVFDNIIEMMKGMLGQANRILARYNTQEPSLWTFWHKWNYEHTWVKNILQFSNRVLKGVNKYHVFRWSWMVGIAGALTGFMVIELEELYYQVKIGYKPTTSNLIIKGVLKNQSVSNKLKQALDVNVFRSSQLQFFVHQALLNQVLSPQKQTIKDLIKISIKSLNNKQTVDNLAELISQNMHSLNQPIQGAALQFLDSPTMDGITANGLKSVLTGLFLKDLIATQANEHIKAYLMQKKNSEAIYLMIRERITF